VQTSIGEQDQPLQPGRYVFQSPEIGMLGGAPSNSRENRARTAAPVAARQSDPGRRCRPDPTQGKNRGSWQNQCARRAAGERIERHRVGEFDEDRLEREP